MNAPATSSPRARRRSAGAACWQKDPAGRRERVLAEAGRLFAERGYAAVTTGQIAAAAGVAEGNVFHYFGSKQNLLREAGARWGRQFAEAMFDGIAPEAGRPVIEGMVGRAFAFVAASQGGFGLFLLSGDPALGPGVFLANRREITLAVERVLREWAAAGIVCVGDAAIVARLLFGLMEAALRACFVEPHDGEEQGRPSPPAIARYVDEVVTAMMRMLEPVQTRS